MSDDPNVPDYWKHKAANTRYALHGVIEPEARVLLDEIADRYERIARIVAVRGRLTRRRKVPSHA
jgi:hypothetical protein